MNWRRNMRVQGGGRERGWGWEKRGRNNFWSKCVMPLTLSITMCGRRGGRFGREKTSLGGEFEKENSYG